MLRVSGFFKTFLLNINPGLSYFRCKYEFVAARESVIFGASSSLSAPGLSYFRCKYEFVAARESVISGASSNLSVPGLSYFRCKFEYVGASSLTVEFGTIMNVVAGSNLAQIHVAIMRS